MRPPSAASTQRGSEDVTARGSNGVAVQGGVLLSAASAARGLRFRGLGDAALATTPFVGVGQLIAVGQVPLLVDLEDGTRVTAAPGTRLWAFALAKTLLLVSGELQATRVVDAQQAGTAPVRIASLAGVVELNPGAELALCLELRTGKAPVAYRAQLSLVRGSATWIAHERTGIAEAQLIAGEPLPKPAPGMHWLSLPARQKTRADRFAALRHVAVSADSDALLDAALTEQEALREHGHALLGQVSLRHAALAQPPSDGAPVPRSPGSPRAFQRELVAHAQRREAQAHLLLSAAERSLLLALAACGEGEPSACTALRAWTHRFATRAAELL
jgi:hypothetical protein